MLRPRLGRSTRLKKIRQRERRKQADIVMGNIIMYIASEYIQYMLRAELS